MQSTKYTLSALATAAAVAFGGVAIAQVSSGDTSAETSASATTELSSGNAVSNSDNLNGSNATSGSVDTQTMGASGSGLSTGANTDLNSDTSMMNNDMESDDLLAPRADRG